MNISESMIDEIGIPIDAIRLSTPDEKKKIDEIQFKYDKKFNAFCLTVSSYPVDKLENMLDKKKKELSDAKSKKRKASSKIKKAEAKAEIEFLTKACHKIGSLIRKKKAYEKL